MRKLSTIVSMLAVVVVAGCGGSGDDSDSPLGDALAYLPADAPFAVAIETDVDGGQLDQAGDALGGFSDSEQLGALAQGLLEQRAGDLEDIEKVLGNPFVVGSMNAGTFIESEGDDTPFVAAIEASDEGALTDLIDKQGAEEDGEVGGAQLYADDSGDSFAVEDGVLIVSDSRAAVEQAIATRDGDDHLTEDDFDEATSSIPDDALLRVYVNVGGMLASSPDAKQALKADWIAALRTAGIGLTMNDDRVAIDFEVATDPEGLSDDDLPLAAGADSPQVVDGTRGIQVSLRDPAQIATFAQTVARSVDPSGFDGFELGREQIERRLELDLEQDVLQQLDNLAATIQLDGSFGVRGDVKDPQAFEQTLTKLADVLPQFAEGVAGEKVGFAEPGPNEDLYALATSGGDRILYGLVDGVFVLSDDPRVAARIAAAETRAVQDAEGALVLSTDAEELLRTVLRQVPVPDDVGFDARELSRALTDGPLDELNGSVEASTSGLTGSFELTLDEGAGGDSP